jgi:CheY-like chemotaxis protein
MSELLNKKGLILFVDDEYYILQTLKAIFRRHFQSYLFEFAQNGEEALEILGEIEIQSHHKLVVFTDWLMPGMKGDELLIQIQNKYPQSVNFLLSGMINKTPSNDVFKRGNIQQVIQKPWNNDELLEILASTLSES